jgi:hypothetical protein
VNVTKLGKMAASCFVKVTGKEISDIEINSVPKTLGIKTCVKILK